MSAATTPAPGTPVGEGRAEVRAFAVAAVDSRAGADAMGRGLGRSGAGSAGERERAAAKTITIARRGDPDVKRQLDDLLTAAHEDANEINAKAGYYVTIQV